LGYRYRGMSAALIVLSVAGSGGWDAVVIRRAWLAVAWVSMPTASRALPEAWLASASARTAAALIGIPSRSEDFAHGRIGIGSLPQDDRPEPRSQRIPILKSRIGDAQTLRGIAAFRRDHCLTHERIGDNALISQLQSVIERPVSPVQCAYQVPGVLENPSAELPKLAGKAQHLGPVCAPGYLTGPFDNRHLKLNGAGNAYGSYQPVRFDIATMDLAKRRQYRDSTGPRQIAE
jgi:hypothetical protein